MIDIEAEAIQADERGIDAVEDGAITSARPVLVQDEPVAVWYAGFEVAADEWISKEIEAAIARVFEAVVDELSAVFQAELLPVFHRAGSKDTAEGVHGMNIAARCFLRKGDKKGTGANGAKRVRVV